MRQIVKPVNVDLEKRSNPMLNGLKIRYGPLPCGLNVPMSTHCTVHCTVSSCVCSLFLCLEILHI